MHCDGYLDRNVLWLENDFWNCILELHSIRGHSFSTRAQIYDFPVFPKSILQIGACMNFILPQHACVRNGRPNDCVSVNALFSFVPLLVLSSYFTI